MLKKKYSSRWPTICATFIIVGSLFSVGLYRLEIDTDIVASLPKSDPVVADGRHVIMNHPAQDRIVIDVSGANLNMDALIEGAEFIEKRLNESGSFKSVGIDKARRVIPDVIFHIVKTLPLLFTKDELEEKIKPLLEPGKVTEAINDNFNKLTNLEGIGQSALMADDPLGLRNFILVKLSQFAPSVGAQIYRGQLLSSDGRHLLILANPRGSGSDTALSKKITAIIKKIEIELNKGKSRQEKFILTSVGAYRSALDNELTAKNDTETAIIFATIGIAFLLLFAFPRPIIGLLALLPAIAGAMMALFVYSILCDSISILAIGFGGAIISISVDHGIAYLLFLDRSIETYGKDAAREVWSVGLLAALTTICAFSFLFISGFPILSQIGRFAALGIFFSFLFVHTIFPLIFPKMPPAKRRNSMPIQNLAAFMASVGGKNKAYAALFLAVIMLFFMKIEFNVDLGSMNAVKKDTLAAEKLVKNVWGDIFSKVYLMIEGSDIQEAQKKGDSIASMLDKDIANNTLSFAFTPSMIFPGEERATTNLQAWKEFWDNGCLSNLRKRIVKASNKVGFAHDAFDGFFDIATRKNYACNEIPKQFYELLGITENSKNDSYMLFSTLTPGENYNAENFYSKYSSIEYAMVFDPSFFTLRLGELLSNTFIKMAFIIGVSVVVLLLFFFCSIKLTIIALLPICFALVCSLGTLNLLGRQLDIPALMLSIIIIGMGIDYSVFFIRSYQRYMDESHPSFQLILTAVFLAAMSSLIGFGVLAFADHSLLRSAGLTSVLGIGYSILGAFTILPPILKYAFKPIELNNEKVIPGSKKHLHRVLSRYRLVEAYPRIFARFKIKLDPMFPKLEEYVESPDVLLDIGCGYGVPSVWLLEIFPEMFVVGIEPDAKRARIASNVFGKRGEVHIGKAPDLVLTNRLASTALMLDMIHHLADLELSETFENIKKSMRDAGTLVIRATIPSEKQLPCERRIENLRLKFHNRIPYFRSIDELEIIIQRAGFKIKEMEPCKKNREETWIIAEMASPN